MSDSTEAPDILLLSLSYQSFLEDMYQPLFDAITAAANLKRAKTSGGALRYLNFNRPHAIIVTDEGLTKYKNSEVLDKVLQYTKDGGILIFGLHFNSFTQMDDFDELFQDKCKLPWASGEYRREDFEINNEAQLPTGAVTHAQLPKVYSMKALHVKNALPEQRLYSAAEYQSSQAAIAGTKYGEGYLAYIGDVNGEDGSNKVLLGLIGLLKT